MLSAFCIWAAPRAFQQGLHAWHSCSEAAGLERHSREVGKDACLFWYPEQSLVPQNTVALEINIQFLFDLKFCTVSNAYLPLC